MHTRSFSYDQFTKGECGLIQEASMLGLPPGEWPEQFTINGYEGVFKIAAMDDAVTIYQNVGDALAPDVHILND